MDNKVYQEGREPSKLPLGCKIQVGTILKWIIAIITLGQGKRLATWFFVRVIGKESCGCCQREEWLNQLTCKSFNGNCNQIKLF